MGRDGGGGVAGGMSDSVLRKVLLSYFYVAVWIFLSFSVIVYNKYILDPKMYNWPFPISLTMVHMGFCSSSPSRSSASSASSTSRPRPP
ncbi:unnamed protein product [Miscanthus lutarioriparius]|uniref:Uncharacterized protein n=1 Tax=Miscanthus lutarioriparius TaxID=422564 RepID=A0A811RWS3_9POAL|nr:unnamed protein product [Miscanthus lutarioriparius]CAD6333365.1 unnamed protein product [Miscanthus lutarioriparius]